MLATAVCAHSYDNATLYITRTHSFPKKTSPPTVLLVMVARIMLAVACLPSRTATAANDRTTATHECCDMLYSYCCSTTYSYA